MTDDQREQAQVEARTLADELFHGNEACDAYSRPAYVAGYLRHYDKVTRDEIEPPVGTVMRAGSEGGSNPGPEVFVHDARMGWLMAGSDEPWPWDEIRRTYPIRKLMIEKE